MVITSEFVWDLWQRIQKKCPLVHCITNIVTVNDCANILLAAGASPTMAHHPAEVEEVTEQCHSLVCNMGATENIDAMIAAGSKAKEAGHPIIVDPVGAAGSAFRRTMTLELIERVSPDCIRGNYSEIKALAQRRNTAPGVDVSEKDIGTKQVIEEMILQAGKLAKITESIVIASGEKDIICDSGKGFVVKNGSSWMAKVTGTGCMSSALLGAFLAEEHSLEAAVAGCIVMGICGEIAEKETKRRGAGKGTYHIQLLDAVSLLKKEDLEKRWNVVQFYF